MNTPSLRMTSRVVAALCFTSLSAFAPGTATAVVKFVTVTTPASTPYLITYVDDSDKWTVTDVSFAALAGEFAGTLTKIVTFKTADPFIIKFSQKAPPADYSATSGGFKLNLKLEVTNGMNNVKWTSFNEELKDFDFTDATKVLDGVRRGSDDHPLYAHFHAAGRVMANYKQTGFLNTNPADIDAVAQYAATGGQINPGQKWTAEGLFLHSMNIKGLPRTFNWIETPVTAAIPEPALWILLGPGVLVTGWMARRRALATDGKL